MDKRVHEALSNGRNVNMYKINVTFEDLLSTGAHFGHLTRKWQPQFKPYILMSKRGIHIINLEETLKNLQKAIDFITDICENGGEILFVGTKKNAKNIVQQEADKCGMFYVVERWLGGTLTNFSTIRKSIKRLQTLEKESSSLYENATKKEILSLEREMIRLQDLHRGIKDMKRLPDALVVVDARHEYIALCEARKLNVPIVAIVDTNTNPEIVDYPIPANDDSIRAIKLILGEIARSICESKSMSYKEDVDLLVADEADEVSTEESEEIETDGELTQGDTQIEDEVKKSANEELVEVVENEKEEDQ